MLREYGIFKKSRAHGRVHFPGRWYDAQPSQRGTRSDFKISRHYLAGVPPSVSAGVTRAYVGHKDDVWYLAGVATDLGTMNDQSIHIIIGERHGWGHSLPFGISQVDQRQHIYVIGKTGSGKTTLLRNLIVQHIALGHGVGLIDPHGDLGGGDTQPHPLPPLRSRCVLQSGRPRISGGSQCPGERGPG